MGQYFLMKINFFLNFTWIVFSFFLNLPYRNKGETKYDNEQ